MEPEIARRCTDCGAAVRGAARFCPQCGRPMSEREAAQGTSRPALVQEAERVAASISGRLAARSLEDADGASGRTQPGSAPGPARDAVAGDDATRDVTSQAQPRQVQPPQGQIQQAYTQQAQTQQTQTQQTQTQQTQAQSTPSPPGQSVQTPQAQVETDAPSAVYSSAQAADGAAADGAAEQTSSREEAGGESEGSVRARASAAGAVVGDSLRPRVERLRERSVVVLDEAADDPGLRFVLVAAALFAVALLLYVFSFVLR